MSEYELEKFEESLKDKIYSICGHQVMLDRDLAELYGVETRRINEQVKRNKERFPVDYCFKLNQIEKNELVAKCDRFNTMKHSSAKPTVFTEHGVAMLSAVLKSDIAVKISIKIINAFIEMRKFIQSNAQVFQRLDSMEIKMIETNLKLCATDSRIDQVFSLMESGEAKFKQGVFFENQIFDAYHVVSDLFRTAKKSILIIDNYVDYSVLVHLTEVAKGVKVKILTKSISEKLSLDIKKFSAQYFPIEAEIFTLAHDRYIVIDYEKVYHVGASLKDLGKKWFAFSKIEKSDMEVISRLRDFDA